MNRRRVLIVNADDFGMTPAISRGILQTCQDGIVRATTAMTNAADFERSMELLRSFDGEIDVGFHATLTWGRPLLPARDLPSLVDRDGYFLSRRSLLMKALSGRLNQEEIERELSAQCARLKQEIPHLSHLDSHHHVHTFPTICRAVQRVAEAHAIPFIRSSLEGCWSPWHWSGVQRGAVALLKAAYPSYWKRLGFQTADHFAGYALGTSRAQRERWLQTLTRLPEGLTEIMVHPGYPSACQDRYNAQRSQETSLLIIPELKRCLDAEGIELSSFSRELAKAQDASNSAAPEPHPHEGP